MGGRTLPVSMFRNSTNSSVAYELSGGVRRALPRAD